MSLRFGSASWSVRLVLRLFELAPAQTFGASAESDASILCRAASAAGRRKRVRGRKRPSESFRAKPAAKADFSAVASLSLTLRQARCGARARRGLRERPEPIPAKYCSRGGPCGPSRKNDPSGRSLRW
ncbi:hypothetical protein [Caulobacter vibrioides]|uniref:Uncharacterized protein n=2 Tax=Caulobacter vibrioides TaxID=155892 RepID=Q9A870_CAUVC|nr:hypothetical protein [Caulobacter vibrioides]YP_002516934.1 hypothetical protein CCNA_01561 [Caulobacter vibrioides NA1000]AAK23473.1 hypothetical protein CC_1494 [Caulobacter vibrioides CB15]ACL95026.1 hypothetical protein CCNA_01561 [Caulobacter vibrioides NA1000]ATC28298.1 hypothetical protein CA607_07885 [Caulobacter vibrioides]QXZ53565.1 hypothetical protein KZH45_07825 [Caulobacter vibrioides]